MNKLFLSLTFMVIAEFLSAQSLQNTKWQTYNGAIGDTITVEVKIDTVHQYIDADSILVSSLFTENNDTVFLVDVGGPMACPSTDTGIYLFSIVNDTLSLTLLSDACFQRSMAYSGVVLWRIDLPTGITFENQALADVAIFPNPSSGLVQLKSSKKVSYRIYNAQGQLVESNRILEADESQIVNLQSGTYFIHFMDERSIQRKRLIIL